MLPTCKLYTYSMLKWIVDMACKSSHEIYIAPFSRTNYKLALWRNGSMLSSGSAGRGSTPAHDTLFQEWIWKHFHFIHKIFDSNKLWRIFQSVTVNCDGLENTTQFSTKATSSNVSDRDPIRDLDKIRTPSISTQILSISLMSGDESALGATSEAGARDSLALNSAPEWV